ncbi:MAG: nicotinamide-nucleotide adenylyltransferase [Thermoproteota archaeon]
MSSMSVATGLYVGRFQPFHRGHLFAVRYALKRAKNLIIVIGSSQKSHELRHPFTLGERIEMIQLAMKEARIPASRLLLVPIQDVEIHPTWVSLIEYSCPSFDIAFSNDPLTIRLLKEAGYRVESVKLQNREELSGTKIRENMLLGRPWTHLVPRSVYSYIKKIHGEERIRQISSTYVDRE